MLLKGNFVFILIFSTFYIKCVKMTPSFTMDALVDAKNNTIVSHLLVRFPLCILASEAKGPAKIQLLSTLGLKSYEVKNCYSDLKDVIEGMKSMDFLSSNKIIVNYTDDVRHEFIVNSADYGVRVDKIGFNYPTYAVSFINQWVDRATFKRITDVLEPNDINDKSSMLIINAGYLKATWESPFDIRSTKNGKFHHLDGKVSVVPMMTKVDSCMYFQDDTMHAQFITLKLASFGVTMSIIVTQTQKGLPELLRKLQKDPNYINTMHKNTKYETIKITLPRFKIKSRLELNKYLQKIGASQIFNETHSGLDAILKENSNIKNIYISKVKQKNFIDVDEMGVFRDLPRETSNEQRYSFGAYEAVCDHPFYFSIDIQTKSFEDARKYQLFQGVYYGPEE